MDGLRGYATDVEGSGGTAGGIILGDIGSAPFDQHEGLEVVIELNEMRQGRVTLNLYDDEAALFASPNMGALDRMLYVTYRDAPQFWGHVIDPVWDTEGVGTVKIEALGPEQRLATTYLRNGDAALALGVPANGVGLHRLADAGRNTPAQVTAGWPNLGIQPGATYSSAASPLQRPERGANAWDAMKALSALVGGPDFEVRPYAPPAEPYGLLEAWAKQGENKTGLFEWRYVEPEDPMNENNVAGATLSPQGSALRNFQVTVLPGDVSTALRVLASHDTSRGRVGNYVGWDAAPGEAGEVPLEALTRRARAIVAAYGHPPPAISLKLLLEPKVVDETWEPPMYGRDFLVGDVVPVYVEKGAFVTRTPAGAAGAIPMRIQKVTLTQADAAGNVQPTVDLVPNIDADALALVTTAAFDG